MIRDGEQLLDFLERQPVDAIVHHDELQLAGAYRAELPVLAGVAAGREIGEVLLLRQLGGYLGRNPAVAGTESQQLTDSGHHRVRGLL